MTANDETTQTDYSRVPDGYEVIANSVALMLVKSCGVGKNPGVYAVCRLEDGVGELLKRFYESLENEVTK